MAAGLFKAGAADVTLTASDTTGTTSFNQAGHWNNSLAHAAGNAYFTGAYELWTPEGGTANYTFAGDALTVSSGGKLIYAGNGAATPPAITINNWTNSGGLVSTRAGFNVNFNSPLTLTGIGNTLDSGTASTNLFSGVISGTASGGLAIGTGSGSTLVVLTNNNTFTGGITVRGRRCRTGSARAPR